MSEDIGQEKYWNESDNKGFAFDDDDDATQQMCGFSTGGTAKLTKQLQDGLKAININTNSDFLEGTAPPDVKKNVDLRSILSKRTIATILQADNLEYSLLREEYADKEDELKILRRKIDERWEPPNIDKTVRAALVGQPYSLELYQSLSLKKELMQAAESLGDGDFILNVVLFLSKSLKKTLFHQILAASPVAVNHYISYLSTRLQVQEVSDILEMLGRSHDAAMKQFWLAVQNPARRHQRLQNCLKNHFSSLKEKKYVENYLNLLEWQDNYGQLHGESVATTLSTLCTNHWGSSKGTSNSPQTFADSHGVCKKIFESIAIKSRASKESWIDLNGIFITKGWLGHDKLSTELPAEVIVSELNKYGAPQNILMTYTQFVDNLEKRLAICKKFNINRSAIDTYALMKDRLGLVSFKAYLDPQSDDYFYAEQVLRTPTIKWKN